MRSINRQGSNGSAEMESALPGVVQQINMLANGAAVRGDITAAGANLCCARRLGSVGGIAV